MLLSSCNTGGANGNSTQQPLFAPAGGSPITIAGGPGNVCIGDMNNDGKPDLVVVSGSEHTGNIIVLLNRAGKDVGQFQAAASGAIRVPDNPGELALGDVNSDGNTDLAFVTHDSYNVTMLLGDGKGRLALAPNSSIVMKDGKHPHTHGLGMADLNGDGKPDLATVNNADNDISIAFGDGRGGFTPAPSSPFAVGPSPYPMALGDVNNDGRVDIVATATATGPARREQLPLSRALTLLVGDGHGGFQTSQVPLRTAEPWFVAVGDINGDRKADLVVTHHELSVLTVLLGNGAGRFTEIPGSPFDLGRNAFQVALADVNHDGRLDVLTAAGNGVQILLGDGSGNFKDAPGSSFLTGKGTWRFALGDMNGDSKIDVVTSSAESNAVSVLLGR